MGRHNFTARQVHETATRMLTSKRISQLPAWHNAVGRNPPPEILTRPVHRAEVGRKKRLSKIFKPLPIVYPEDSLRSEFFGDHPWELARPKIVLENDGNDAKNWDWKQIQQPGKKLDGESVIQRQLWLINNENLSKSVAYDKARKEFYHYRHLEDVERRVAKEEALATGAYFGKNALEIGMDLENKAWENWKVWAQKQITEAKHMAAASYSGPIAEEEEPTMSLEEGDAAEEVAESA